MVVLIDHGRAIVDRRKPRPSAFACPAPTSGLPGATVGLFPPLHFGTYNPEGIGLKALREVAEKIGRLKRPPAPP
jgi:hypothetical protein